MRIALIRPNMGDYRSGDAMPPLVMGILAARASGHEILFYDDRVEAVPKKLDADLVAMSVETFTARRAYELAAHFRRQGMRLVIRLFYRRKRWRTPMRSSSAMPRAHGSACLSMPKRDACSGFIGAIMMRR